MLTFRDFLKQAKPLNFTVKKYTHEEFLQELQPVMCALCRRIFNPTEEEKETDRRLRKETEDLGFAYEWEIVIPKYTKDETLQ